MDFGSLVEGPFLAIVSVVFCIGLLSRLAFFINAIVRRERPGEEAGENTAWIFLRSLAPFHRATPKRPLYASLRYLFHICLFVVPIWFAGHISLWEESRFEWTWVSLPDEWADWMTLVLLVLAVFFLFRHAIFKEVRKNSSFSDYLIIVIVAFPFATGYALTHGTLEETAFFADNLWTMHVLSGEIMILAAAFLFCRTRLNQRKCTGCASCVLSCPTGTLESADSGNMRHFTYAHYQCICCGACVNTCPEDAAELRHEISLKRYVQVLAKKEIRAVELESCKRCGALFVPEPLMEKVHKTIAQDYLDFCPDCRKAERGDYLKRITPWHEKRKYSSQKGLQSSS